MYLEIVLAIPDAAEPVADEAWTLTQQIAAAVASAVVVIAGLVKWLGPKMKKVEAFLDDWNGTPTRPGYPGRPSMPERVESLEKVAGETHHQVAVNGGTSSIPTLRDDISNLSVQLKRHEDEGQAIMQSALDQLKEQGITIHIEPKGDNDQ